MGEETLPQHRERVRLRLEKSRQGPAELGWTAKSREEQFQIGLSRSGSFAEGKLRLRGLNVQSFRRFDDEFSAKSLELLRLMAEIRACRCEANTKVGERLIEDDAGFLRLKLLAAAAFNELAMF
jgi:hypothetical protein